MVDHHPGMSYVIFQLPDVFLLLARALRYIRVAFFIWLRGESFLWICGGFFRRMRGGFFVNGRKRLKTIVSAYFLRGNWGGGNGVCLFQYACSVCFSISAVFSADGGTEHVPLPTCPWQISHILVYFCFEIYMSKSLVFLKVLAKTDITMLFTTAFYVDCIGRN